MCFVSASFLLYKAQFENVSADCSHVGANITMLQNVYTLSSFDPPLPFLLLLFFFVLFCSAFVCLLVYFFFFFSLTIPNSLKINVEQF